MFNHQYSSMTEITLFGWYSPSLVFEGRAWHTLYTHAQRLRKFFWDNSPDANCHHIIGRVQTTYTKSVSFLPCGTCGLDILKDYGTADLIYSYITLNKSFWAVPSLPLRNCVDDSDYHWNLSITPSYSLSVFCLSLTARFVASALGQERLLCVLKAWVKHRTMISNKCTPKVHIAQYLTMCGRHIQCCS